ncbi:integrase core domain protein [Lasius niger]|uniref:RNA-directed DNA polymerase n=1 Tax=Lasius niger TaxID=67767 RepID=A0A0J7KI25_LASNI|nr:integrase core domain protein [Lasius niger]
MLDVREGKVDNKECFFKVDTGSDVSIISSKFVEEERRRICKNCVNLRYPTGEKVDVKFWAEIKVELGKYSVVIPMFVAEINDECLLGIDFLKKINLDKVFTSVFGTSVLEKEIARIEDSFERVPIPLKELYETNSRHLNGVEKKNFVDFLNEFEDLFSENIIAENCSVVEHVVNVQDSLPIKQVPRRIPIQMRGEVEKILEDMSSREMIEESQSPWVSPAVMVKNKDGSIRFYVDYRKLNAVTIKDSYPLPRIDEILDQLAGNSWFSTLDLKSGYWQIKIRPEDKEKTAFSIGKGLWQFTLVVPRERVKKILEETHDSPTGGHFGVNKTLEKIRKRFFWATCKQDVEEWCKTCKICISRKGPSGKGKSPLQIYNVGAPLERIQMDILGPLPLTRSGNKYLLVIVDCFTKWVEAFPIKNIRTSTVAEVFVNQFISRHGIPVEVHTDQGRNFESQLFSELMILLGIRKARSTALHPQSDGQVVRQHRTISNFIAKFVSKDQKDWDRWIPMFLLAYRSSKHEVTGVTPQQNYTLLGNLDYPWIFCEEILNLLKKDYFRKLILLEI